MKQRNKDLMVKVVEELQALNIDCFVSLAWNIGIKRESVDSWGQDALISHVKSLVPEADVYWELHGLTHSWIGVDS